jgi:hypothetical protein
MRLGAWAWLARTAGRHMTLPAKETEGFDDATCFIVALLGLYYLGSGI